MRKYLLLLFITIVSLPATAQLYQLTGRITDQNNKPAGFTSVYIKNSTYGTVANEEGLYQLKLATGSYDVIYRLGGYKEVAEKISIGDHDVQHNVQLQDESYQLQQFGKNNKVQDSAVDIIQRVINKRQFYLEQVKQYSCVAYVKGVQKLDGAPKALMGQNVSDALSVDSAGKGMLYQSESLSNYSFEQPDKVKEEMIASKKVGQNTAFSYNKASDLAINFYNNIILLLDALGELGH